MNPVELQIPERFSKARKLKWYIPKRYIFTLMSFLGLVNVYAMRVNLSVALVAMINSTTSNSLNYSSHYIECFNLVDENSFGNPSQQFEGVQYNWDSKTQGVILGSFFYGYILTQIPGGIIAEKYGAKWLFGGGVLVTAVFTLLTPLAANLGVAALIVVRVIEGFGEGVTFPAINFLLSRWSQKFERSRMSTIIFTGAQIGNVVSMPISGWLSGSDLLGGWPSVFYLFGTLGVIWFIFWCFLVYETPAVHPKISKNELIYIVENQEKMPAQSPAVPWKQIITSLPMWAVIISHFGHNWGFLILLTELPSYLNTILHFNIQSNGLLSALPYILQAAAAWAASYLADKLRKSGIITITTIRKICNSIGLFGPAICLLGVTASGCNPLLIVALISLAMCLNGFIYSGFNITHVDMSPNLSGTLFGITNAVANICGVLGPAAVGYFTSTGATIRNWSEVFYITAAIYTITAVFYNVFASAELQPWDSVSSNSKKNNALDAKRNSGVEIKTISLKIGTGAEIKSAEKLRSSEM